MTSDNETGDPALASLARLLRAAGMQVDALMDGLERPDVNLANLSAQSLDLVMRAVAAEAAALSSSADAELGAAAREVHAQLERWFARSVRAEAHLLEMAADWTCARCGSDVPEAAAVTGVRVGDPKVALVCRACGEQSPPTRQGLRRFHAYFGELFRPEWRPTANGFRWDGT